MPESSRPGSSGQQGTPRGILGQSEYAEARAHRSHVLPVHSIGETNVVACVLRPHLTSMPNREVVSAADRYLGRHKPAGASPLTISARPSPGGAAARALRGSVAKASSESELPSTHAEESSSNAPQKGSQESDAERKSQEQRREAHQEVEGQQRARESHVGLESQQREWRAEEKAHHDREAVWEAKQQEWLRKSRESREKELAWEAKQQEWLAKEREFGEKEAAWEAKQREWLAKELGYHDEAAWEAKQHSWREQLAAATKQNMLLQGQVAKGRTELADCQRRAQALAEQIPALMHEVLSSTAEPQCTTRAVCSIGPTARG